MPLTTEHSARIVSPSQFNEFARSNDEFGEGIDVIFGIDDGQSEVQSIRFDADKFTAEEARQWLKEHDYNPIKFEPAVNSEEENTSKAESDAPEYRESESEVFNCLNCKFADKLDMQDGQRNWCELYAFEFENGFVCNSYVPKTVEGVPIYTPFDSITPFEILQQQREYQNELASRIGLRKILEKYNLKGSGTLKKQDDELQVVSGPVLIPGEKDLQGDVITPETIEEAANEFLQKYREINIMHSEEFSPLANGITVIQSAVLKNDVDYYGDGDILKKGTWIMDTHIGNDTIWNLIKEGKITGYSIEGIVDREEL